MVMLYPCWKKKTGLHTKAFMDMFVDFFLQPYLWTTNGWKLSNIKIILCMLDIYIYIFKCVCAILFIFVPVWRVAVFYNFFSLWLLKVGKSGGIGSESTSSLMQKFWDSAMALPLDDDDDSRRLHDTFCIWTFMDVFKILLFSHK